MTAVNQPDQASYALWPEDNDRPYFTDKPGWDSLGAMLLVAACYSYREPVPVAISKGWDYTENPLIAQMSEDKIKVWSLFRGVTLWLPFPDSVLFLAPLPTGKQAMIATTAGLRKELEKLNVLA